MAHYQYLIIGGGMTADAAVKGIREVDTEGEIGIVSADADPPYDRPPLSKGMWKGKPLDDIFRGTDDSNVALHLGRTATALDADNKQVTDDAGETYTYDKLLLATGGSPRQLPFGDEHVIYFRTAADYRRLREMAESDKKFAVLGGGFIGSEIAAALSMSGREVVILFPEDGIGGLQFPTDLSSFLNDYYREKGVEVLAGELADGLEQSGDRLTLKTRSGKTVEVDAVVAGLGLEPNVQLAADAGLDVDDGIVVNEMMQTSNPDIYAAGDVAAFHNPALDQRIRVEHEDNANTMGQMAGKAMAGQAEPYHHLPFFYSDLFELGYEAVGELDPSMETVADWGDEYHKGVVYYLKDGRVRGVLLWDTWGQTDAATSLIAEAGPFSADDLKGRISG